MRLNKYLARSGIASRRKCDLLIKAGKVKVIYGNGAEGPSVQKVKKEKKDTEEKTFLTEEE